MKNKKASNGRKSTNGGGGGSSGRMIGVAANITVKTTSNVTDFHFIVAGFWGESNNLSIGLSLVLGNGFTPRKYIRKWVCNV